jgi:hypothetical protein
MLDERFDSYGFNEPEQFTSLQIQKKLEYLEPTDIAEKLTEVESFISEAGQPLNDLKVPVVTVF